MRVIGYLFVVLTLAGLLIGVGVKGAWQQHQMLQSYRAVPASVQDRDMRSSRYGGFEPDVNYSYSVGGNTLESQRVAPLRINGSRDWIESVLSRVQAEGMTAYVNPDDSADAYLLPIGRFRPYGLILVGLALLGVSLLPLRRGGMFERESGCVTSGPYDWYELTPESSPSGRVVGYFTAMVLWYLLGGLTIGHYFLTVPPDYEIKALISTALFAGLGLWPVHGLLKSMGVASRIATPKARITRSTVHLDEPIIVRIEQPFVRDTTLREVRVALTCTRRNGLGAVKYFTASHIVAENRAVRNSERIEGEFTFEVPEKKRHPSTPFSRWDYPRTDWQIEIITRTDKSVSSVVFPIIAEHTTRKAKAA